MIQSIFFFASTQKDGVMERNIAEYECLKTQPHKPKKPPTLSLTIKHLKRIFHIYVAFVFKY